MIENISQRLVVLTALLIGPVGVLLPKGTVVVLAVAGLAGLVRWAGDKFPRPPVKTSLILTLAALVSWVAVSAAWSFEPARALSLLGRLVLVGLAGAGFLYAISRLDFSCRRRAQNALLGGIAVGLAVLAVGFFYAMATGGSLWDTYFFDPLTTLNNGAVTISLLAWPTMAVALRRNKTAAVLVAALTYLGFMFLSSGAALLAPAAGLIGFVIVWFGRSPGAFMLGAVTAVLVLMAPQVVTYGLPGENAAAIAFKLPSSARHRLVMWSFAVEKIDEKPFLGWGMDASRAIPQEDRRLGPEMEIMPLHPHNAFLQVRLELGMPGAVLVAALVGMFFAAAGKIEDRFSSAVAVGAGMSYLSVAAVSYGVWQNWWWAFAWALAAMTMLALKPRSS